MNEMKDKIDKLIPPCICHSSFSDRGKEDPKCRHHETKEVIDQILALFDEKYKDWKSPEEAEKMKHIRDTHNIEFCNTCNEPFLWYKQELNEKAQLAPICPHCIQKEFIATLIDPTSFTTSTVEEKCGDCGGSGCKVKVSKELKAFICKHLKQEGCEVESCTSHCPTCHGSKEIDVEQGAFVKCDPYMSDFPCQDGYRRINKLEQIQMVWEWRRLK